MALAGSNLVARDYLEAPLPLLNKLKSFESAPAVVMVRDGDNVEVRMVLDILKDLPHTGETVSERCVHVQISFAPLDGSFGFRVCGIRIFLCMTVVGMIHNGCELCDFFS
jgi:hypothetical protein